MEPSSTPEETSLAHFNFIFVCVASPSPNLRKISETTKHHATEEFTGEPLESITPDTSVEQYAVTKLDDDRFSLWSVLGVQYTLGCAPLAIAGYMQFTLGIGGSAYFFWCFIVAAIGQCITVLNFAELASAFPHVAGRCMGVVTDAS